MSGKRLLVFGGAAVVFGLLLAVRWTMFAALYVPQCPQFTFDAPNHVCRWILGWVYGGYTLAALGGVVFLAGIVRVATRRVMTNTRRSRS